MELTMETILDFKFKNASERMALKDIYDEDQHGTHEDFYSFIQAWIQTGRAKVVNPNQTKESQMADLIAEELMTVQKGKTIEQDRVERAHYNQGTHGFYKKVGFPSKTLIDAQEMHQQLIRNFNLKPHQLGVEMTGAKVVVTITDCPVKTYASIERAFGFKRATEAVSGVVDKTANSVVNTTDMVVNNIAVPVAKTAISTGAKIGKSLFGFGAKLAGIAVGEITKATKQCVTEIKNDGYIAEAKGELIDSIHNIRRTVGNTSFGNNGGMIME